MLLLGAALVVAIVGALLDNPWATGAGGVALLALLARHTAVTDPAVPRLTRRLLRAGLALLALAIVVEVSGWVGVPPSGTDLVAFVTDPARQWTQFLRQSAVAVCLVLACGCFGLAVGQLPPARLRRFGGAVPVVGALTLVALVFLALLPAGLVDVLGSVTNVLVAAGLVLGGYAWVVGRAVRRGGAAPVAAVGATVLALMAWQAADSAWRDVPSRQRSPVAGAAEQVSVAVAVRVETGPDVAGAGAVAALLVGAVLTVLACARLSRTDGG